MSSLGVNSFPHTGFLVNERKLNQQVTKLGSLSARLAQDIGAEQDLGWGDEKSGVVQDHFPPSYVFSFPS
jgi:hypothetical protein